MKVLAVEDDNASLAILRRSLERLGHEVIEARDGEEAWALWSRDRPRVVVSDWRMPKLDGLQLCKKLRAQQGQDYVYFILLTGSGATGQNRRDAAEAGVDDFLTKPVDMGALWMRLRVAERILSYTFQVYRLEEMMPMCSYCKKIRDDHNYWQQIESYINERTGTEISHSVCPDCYQRVVVPELARLKEAAALAPVAKKVAVVKKTH
ncbi:MAG TPA: response regulator [Opitutaceae bacterium]|nr:response regulator [Opitutaceae bacterium]